jgi:hypothetical protein
MFPVFLCLGSVWNPLYLRTDAAVKALAAEYGVREGEILDREADNLATRAVLVETHVIKQTKDFLEQVRCAGFCSPLRSCGHVCLYRVGERGLFAVCFRRVSASRQLRRPFGALRCRAALPQFL